MPRQKWKRLEALASRLPAQEQSELVALCIRLAQSFLSEYRRRTRKAQGAPQARKRSQPVNDA